MQETKNRRKTKIKSFRNRSPDSRQRVSVNFDQKLTHAISIAHRIFDIKNLRFRKKNWAKKFAQLSSHHVLFVVVGSNFPLSFHFIFHSPNVDVCQIATSTKYSDYVEIWESDAVNGVHPLSTCHLIIIIILDLDDIWKRHTFICWTMR